jgi:hypothetical protein
MIPRRSLTLKAFDESGQGRVWTAPLHFTVSVEQTKRRRPNKGSVEVWNLSRGSIGYFESSAKIVEVIADGVGLLYRGNPRKIVTRIDGPDWITEMELADGGRAYRDAKLSRSYAPGITTRTVLADLAAAAGWSVQILGTLDDVVYESGHYVSGRVVDAIDELIATAGAEWSVQDGQVRVVCSDAPATGGVVLSPGSGLIGSPSRKDKGIEVEALLQPSLRPGSLFKLESKFIEGWWRVTKTQHSASSDGEEWRTHIEAKKP